MGCLRLGLLLHFCSPLGDVDVSWLLDTRKSVSGSLWGSWVFKIVVGWAFLVGSLQLLFFSLSIGLGRH